VNKDTIKKGGGFRKGKVYLVGAGPGDPGLITVKGLDCLRKADVIVYDRLVDDSLLIEACPKAEKIYVGKAAKKDTWKQEDINRLLLDRAREGKVIVRLKGGDPFVFGRGGEEAELLAMHHISFEIVPGISSALAVPAYAGIPVTHRKFASSFTVITGHEAHHKSSSNIEWRNLSSEAGTLVILMGMANLAKLVNELIKKERPPSTPVAVISDGTSHRQKCVTGTLETIIAKVKSESIQPPAVVVVGKVARLREHLSWFDNRPLLGKRILIIGTIQQSTQMSQLLRACGALPVALPVVEIELAPFPNELDQAIINLQDYHWLIFTSIIGVEAFFQRLFSQNYDARQLSHLRIGAMGPTTAKVLEDKGLRADYIPTKYTIKSFLNELKGQEIAGRRVLLPRSDRAEDRLAVGLVQLGAKVQEVVAYRTILNAETISEGAQMLLFGEIDIIAFTSPFTVANVVTVLNKEHGHINKTVVACIGPKTAAAASKAGVKVSIVARKHTIPGLIEAIEGYFKKEEDEV